jgi:hypothetical protein
VYEFACICINGAVFIEGRMGEYLWPTRHERSTRLPRSIRRNLNNGGAGTSAVSSNLPGEQ